MTTLELVNPQHTTVELESRVKVSAKGQIVIPVDIRRAAGIEDGNAVLKCSFKDGQITLEVQHYLNPTQLFGIFNEPQDDGLFTLDLESAREERADFILKKGL